MTIICFYARYLVDGRGPTLYVCCIHAAGYPVQLQPEVAGAVESLLRNGSQPTRNDISGNQGIDPSMIDVAYRGNTLIHSSLSISSPMTIP